MNNLNLDLKINGKKLGTYKSTPNQRFNRMLCPISRWENYQDIHDNAKCVLSYNDPNLCNNYISKEQDCVDQFSINFSRHCVLGHVLSDTDLLDEMDSWKEVVGPSKKPKSVDPHIEFNKNIKESNKQQQNVTKE